MSTPVYARGELLAELGIAEETLAHWEKLGLIIPVGILDDGKNPFYTDVAVQEARQIQQLLSLGYDIEGIQKIVRKVGFPSKRKKGSRGREAVLLTVGQLAEATGLNARTIKYWEERSILQPDGRSVGGFRLYSPDTVEFCALIRDLQNFGYSLEEIRDAADLIRDFDSISKGTSTLPSNERTARLEDMAVKLTKVEERIHGLRDGIKRWDNILKKQRREIQQLLAKAKAERKPANKNTKAAKSRKSGKK
jgi:DNA-binding transcriptional MerR regulator